MSKVVKALYESNLDFAIRGTGTGSVSAKDVILSTHGFKQFEFDERLETVTIGSGFTWGEVDALMEKYALGYQLPTARCSFVGVAGSTLVGGLSWLSHEFGMMSDPQNLLDAQVVLHDGRVLWASEEPDLMWALRGGGGNFGGQLIQSNTATMQLTECEVVTALKFRARPYPPRVFSGFIFIPYSSLRETSKGVATMAARPADPKVAMHVSNGINPGARPDIAIFMYDANGEKHARSEEGFAWALRLPGAVTHGVQERTLAETNKMFDGSLVWQGKHSFWLSAPLIENVDDETLIRAWKWYEDSINLNESFQEGSKVLFEFMQGVSIRVSSYCQLSVLTLSIGLHG